MVTEATEQLSAVTGVPNTTPVAVQAVFVVVLTAEGAVMVGYRTYPDGPMQEVQALLDDIVKEAME